jgi:NADH-quinone oxidoreductase subunit K
MLPIADYLFLSFALLLIGVVGAATRRSLIIKLFSIELILNAAAINLMAFARFFAEANGEAFAGFTIAIVVAEVLVALAIIAAVFTRWLNLSPAKPPAQNPEQGANGT